MLIKISVYRICSGLLFLWVLAGRGVYSQDAPQTQQAFFPADAAQRRTLLTQFEVQGEVWTSPFAPVPLKVEPPFFTCALRVEAGHPVAAWEAAIRFSPDGQNWKAWQPFLPDHEGGESELWVSQLMFISEHLRFFQVRFRVAERTAGENMWKGMRWDFFHPGESPSPMLPQRPSLAPRSEGVCPQPAFVDRLGWGSPEGNAPSCDPPEYSEVSHLIVHHSAGTNVSDDWAAVVRAIYFTHRETRGWCDIGYNWLIAPDGVIFQGRGGGENVKGAHFCRNNTGTMGVCMLGNYMTGPPTAASLARLDTLLAWKACLESILPLDTVFHPSSGVKLPTVCGHRDGCDTLCPGDSLYTLLPGIRQRADALARLFGLSTSVTPSWEDSLNLYPQPAGDWLILEHPGSRLSPDAVRCFDLLGRRYPLRVYPQPGASRLVLEGAQTGIYLLEVEHQGRLFRQKIWMIRD